MDRPETLVSRTRLAVALLVLRLGAGAFLVVWASLKFLRPEWMVNVFRGTYGIASASPDWAYAVGAAQMTLVALFVIGLGRRIVYPAVVLMHATGVVGAALSGALWNFTNYPQNLLWTSVAALGALVALALVWRADTISVGGWLAARRPAREDGRLTGAARPWP